MSKAAKGPAGPFAQATADEIRAELARRNLDQKNLAEMTGISTSYLSARLRGDLPFDLNDVEAIAIAFELAPNTLTERAEILMASRGDTPASAYGARLTGRGSVTGAASPEKVEQLKQTRRARSK